jgi:hypothetical protein
MEETFVRTFTPFASQQVHRIKYLYMYLISMHGGQPPAHHMARDSGDKLLHVFTGGAYTRS